MATAGPPMGAPPMFHGPSLPDTFGAALVAGMIALVLFGITTLQAYQYYINYPEDAKHLRTLVSVVWIQDALHAIFMCHALYFYLITNFANPRRLADAEWSLITSIAFSSLIAVTVKCWYTRRLFLLAGPVVRWYLVLISGLLLAGHLAFGLSSVISIGVKKHFSKLPSIEFIGPLPFGIFAAASDLFISASLCALLYRKRTNFSTSNALIQKLVMWAINRCLLNCAIVLAQLFAFIIQPTGFWPVAFDFVCGQLYANSLLAVLCSRRTVSSSGYDDELLSPSYSSTHSSRRRLSGMPGQFGSGFSGTTSSDPTEKRVSRHELPILKQTTVQKSEDFSLSNYSNTAYSFGDVSNAEAYGQTNSPRSPRSPSSPRGPRALPPLPQSTLRNNAAQVGNYAAQW